MVFESLDVYFGEILVPFCLKFLKKVVHDVQFTAKAWHQCKETKLGFSQAYQVLAVV